MAFVMDNATNDNMLHDIEARCQAEDIPFDATQLWLWCMPHTIHLAALQAHPIMQPMFTLTVHLVASRLHRNLHWNLTQSCRESSISRLCRCSPWPWTWWWGYANWRWQRQWSPTALNAFWFWVQVQVQTLIRYLFFTLQGWWFWWWLLVVCSSNLF